MKRVKYNRAKEHQVQLGPDFYSSYYSCVKHPSFDSVGICAFCLHDRLLSLLCSDCGEQRWRLSSCSCSSLEVGRISFLIENERQTSFPNLHRDQIIKLKRSRSTHGEIKRSRSGFWRLSSLFRMKQNSKQSRDDDDNEDGSSWGCVSRSRSICSFRGGGWKGVATSEEVGGGSVSVSGGRSSGVTLEPEHRQSQTRSGIQVEGPLSDFSEKKVKRVGKCGIRESDFEAVGESGFIDLDLEELGKQSISVQRSGADKMTLNDCVLGREEMKVKKRKLRLWRWIFGRIIM